MSTINEKWTGNIPKRNIILHTNSLGKGKVVKFDYTYASNNNKVNSSYLGVVEDEKRIILSGMIDLGTNDWSSLLSETINNGDILYLSTNGDLTKNINEGYLKEVILVLTSNKGIVYPSLNSDKRIISFSNEDLIGGELVIEDVYHDSFSVRDDNGIKVFPQTIYNFANKTLTFDFSDFVVENNWTIYF